LTGFQKRAQPLLPNQQLKSLEEGHAEKPKEEEKNNQEFFGSVILPSLCPQVSGNVGKRAKSLVGMPKRFIFLLFESHHLFWAFESERETDKAFFSLSFPSSLFSFLL